MKAMLHNFKRLRDGVGALPLKSVECDFFRVAARQHLGHQASVVRRLVARMGMLKRLPVVSKDLLEDIPVPRGGCHHRSAPSGGDQIVAMERLYHASAASSTPHPASLRYPHPTRLSLLNESFRDRKNAFSYTIKVWHYGVYHAYSMGCHGGKRTRKV